MLGVKEYECTVISNKNVATFIKEFKVQLPKGAHMDFLPGSYAQIKIPTFSIDYDKDIDKELIGDEYLPAWKKFGLFPLKCVNTEPTIRAYSMANYPAEGDVFMLTVRIATPPFKADRSGFMDVNPGIASSYLSLIHIYVNVGIGKNSSNKLWDGLKDAQVNRFVGPCPAANVGVQINHIDPVNKGEVVWTVDPVAVLFIGRLVNNGRVDLTRLVAVAGAEIKTPEYAEALVGTPLCMILKGKLKRENGIRIINGNPLTGRKATADDFLGAHTSEVCVIPEGNDADEMFGWIMPRLNQFSANHS